ncbi:MAG: peptidoglycan recognition protein family protein, partial [Caldisericaceae bacterium]
MRKIQYIVLHHSATDYQANKDDVNGGDIAKAICKNQSLKWIKQYPDYACDYHFLIGHTGQVFKGQLVEKPGWHCTNYQANLVSIGICFLGNFENIEMPIEQFNAGVNLI